MKKIIALFIIACMLITTLSIAATAEETTPEKPKLYVSNQGNDETGNGTQENPYKTVEGAFEKMPTTGGDIVVMNDVAVFTSFNKNVLMGNLNIAIVGGVHIYGLKQPNGTYPTLDFQEGNEKAQATIVYMSCDMMFSDITFNCGGQNLVISAAYHDLIFGYNVTMNMGVMNAGTENETACYVRVNGSFEGATGTQYMASDKASNISIWSGSFQYVNAGGQYRTNNGGTSSPYTVTSDSVVNVYGGEITGLRAYREGDKYDGMVMTNVTFNVYGGEIETLHGNEWLVNNEYNIVANLYNGMDTNGKITTYSGVFAYDDAVTKGYIAVGGTVDIPEPPDGFALVIPDVDDDDEGDMFDDIGGAGTNDDANDVADTETEATNETSNVDSSEADTEADEEKGCGSTVGAMSIAIAVASVAVAAVSRKKKD